MADIALECERLRKGLRRNSNSQVIRRDSLTGLTICAAHFNADIKDYFQGHYLVRRRGNLGGSELKLNPRRLLDYIQTNKGTLIKVSSQGEVFGVTRIRQKR